MPPPQAILATLRDTANDWRWLAVVWHVLLFAFVAGLAAGWRPALRRTSSLLVLPVVSVGGVAWRSGNPFNGAVFLALSAILAGAASRLPDAPLRLASSLWIAPAAAVVAFGAIYPHFLETTWWGAYIVASPLGLLPCPTLSVVIGLTLAIAPLRSGVWGAALMLAGLFYAIVGVFVLGVPLDWGLFIAVALLCAALGHENRMWGTVRAAASERTRRLPGDDLIHDPLGAFTHAITIRRPHHDVWPWLVQMGAGTRAGWYSYDWLDNGRRPSATRLVPELQAATVGTLFPAVPGATDGFEVLEVQPHRALVLGWPNPGHAPRVTWAFVLEPGPCQTTRLIVRVRGARDYRFRGLPPAVSKPIIRLVHFVMQRRQLRGIARRAESMEAAPAATVGARAAEGHRV